MRSTSQWSTRTLAAALECRTCAQEENVRRKEHAAKRKAVETGKLDAESAGGAKRQRMWWEDELAHGRQRGGGDGVLAADEVNDAEYYKAEVRASASVIRSRCSMPRE